MSRLIAVALLAALAACASTRPRTAREESTAVISEKARARPDSDPAWERLYAAKDLDGEPIAPAFEENPITLVIVFATWCEHCREELAIIAELRTHEEKLSIVGVNAYEDWKDKSDETRMRAWVTENAPWMRVVRADRGTLAALGGVPKIPSMFLFDADGRRLATFKRDERQPPDLNELRNVVQGALSR